MRWLRPAWPERLLLLVASLLLGGCACAYLDAGIYQWLQGHRLEGLLGQRSGLVGALGFSSSTATGAREQAAASNPIGRIEIVARGVRAIIAEGTDSRTLRRAVGHLPGTAFPGERGNVVLAGHRDSFFRRLEGVTPEDRVRITTPDGAFDYRVESTVVVAADRTDVLDASADAMLTLITCYPFGFVGPAPERFVVRARLVSPET
jgi:LPXTG-site transpeptidase (sortase) family protein